MTNVSVLEGSGGSRQIRSFDPAMPKVSVGLAVYNGADYVAQAIESILAQTFEDFELIICDNASTDETEAICRSFAERDPRVSYHRNERNLGSSGNFKRAFVLARGEYFRWAAHDDIILPTYLEKCLEVLESDPTIVLCHTQTVTIDENTNLKHQYRACTVRADSRPHIRFRSASRSGSAYFCWGLVRREIAAKTRLLGPFASHDLPYVSSLSLHGRLVELPEPLFWMRDHVGRLSNSHDFRSPQDWIGWFDSSREGQLTFPAWRLLSEHAAGVSSAPLGLGDRMRCRGELVRWIWDHRGRLSKDLVLASFGIPLVGSRLVGLYSATARRRWRGLSDRIAGILESKTRAGGGIILVDDNKLESAHLSSLDPIPFIEHEGAYWGPPANSREAIRELTRLESEGARFIAFTRPAFWWLDIYEEFHDHLLKHGRCVLEDPNVRLFELNGSGNQ